MDGLLTKDLFSNDLVITQQSFDYIDALTQLFLLIGFENEFDQDDCDSKACLILASKFIDMTSQLHFEKLKASVDNNLNGIESSLNELKQKWKECVVQMKKEQTFHSKIENKIKFYNEKFKECYVMIKQKEQQLNSMGFNSSIDEHSINVLKENNFKLSEHLEMMKAKLDRYKDVKPNEEAFKEKINQMKKEINEYENYFNRPSL